MAGEASSLYLNVTLSTALAEGARIAIALPDGSSIAAAPPQFEVVAPGGVAWDVELPAAKVTHNPDSPNRSETRTSRPGIYSWQTHP